MSETAALVATLKQALKAAGKTYLDVADALNLSEASVKQMFASNRITIARLDSVCNDVLGIEISDLVQQMRSRVQYVAELTEQQERQLVANLRLLVVAVSVMNNWTPEEIVQQFKIDQRECRQHLRELEKLKLISVRPNGSVRLLIDRNFQWRVNGPIQRFFQQHIQNDFLDSGFDRPGEKLVFLTGMLSRKSALALIRRMEKLAAEFLELNQEDSSLELHNRIGSSIIIALRPWQMAAFAELRRGDDSNIA